ncbi:hypothetical protein PP938_gp050 [Rhizobium phage AF3]|uniref:Uncharacterized protein n=1 Tax=Rhizobium phage AF3 TaxID=2763529 RepID=A0A7G7WWC6_9CAUD|nr:hypothetical protein PP938_gp050 [Rhizobium phage AF3]QNH71520.1 hypothetical protein AF3_050 [Rhizobium phage AF3]
MKFFGCYRYIPGSPFGLPVAIFESEKRIIQWRSQNWKRFATYVSTDEWNTLHIIKTTDDLNGNACHSLLLKDNSYKNLKNVSSTYLIGTPYLPAG